ncbi:MAG: ATP-binding protein [Candidatus Izemoplasma sp.]
MNELSLHILDICQNSTKANATLIEIIIVENTSLNEMIITIKDNGHGMDQNTLQKVVDPFFTTRTTRNVGLGIALFKLAAEQTNGSLTISSILNKGTELKATLTLNHIDRAPLGKIEDTLLILLSINKYCDIHYKHINNDQIYELDTREIKKVLEVKTIIDYDIILWVKNNIKEGIINIHKEV